jgi:hypothetical protein
VELVNNDHLIVILGYVPHSSYCLHKCSGYHAEQSYIITTRVYPKVSGLSR